MHGARDTKEAVQHKQICTSKVECIQLHFQWGTVPLVCIILSNSLLTKVIFWLCKRWGKKQHNHTHDKGWCRVHLPDGKQNSLWPGVPLECHLCHKKYVFIDNPTQCTRSKTKQKSFFMTKTVYFWFAEPVYSSKRQKKLGIQKNSSTTSRRLTVLRCFLV